MLPTFSNLLTSNFLLYLNNRILNQCQAYYTVGTQFYPINQTYNGYFSYSLPFKPLCSDMSVSGVSVMTGLYLNNNFIVPGQSGFVGIDYQNGNAYFSSPLPSNSILSGNYSFNEINVTTANFSDPTVLFESKLQLRPKQPQIPTGLLNNQLTYPSIFLKNEGGENSPWALGGLKQTKADFSAYIFAESQFQLDAIVSNFMDSYYEYVPFLNINEFPYNNMGGFKNNIPFNYTGVVGDRVSAGQGVLIEKVNFTDWGKRTLNSDIIKMTTDSFFSLVSFTLSRERLTN